jgi:hypothetical protein
MDKEKLIKSSGMSEEELNMLREKFLNEYAKTKGWNPKRLSTNQMLEISSQKEYKTPGLILG